MVTSRFTIDAGWAVFGAVYRNLEAFLFAENLGYTLTKRKGFPEGKILVEIRGEKQKVDNALKSINNWLETNQH